VLVKHVDGEPAESGNIFCGVTTIIGALNWGLWGAFQLDLVAALFGGQTAALSRVVYMIVGLAGFGLIYTSMLATPNQSATSERDKLRRAA